MSDLAAKMAARRKKLDEAGEDDGLYFSGPNSGQKNNPPSRGPPSRGPPSAHGNGTQNGFGDVRLQEEEEEEEEEEQDEDGGDLQAQIEAYQQQLRTQDTAKAVMSGQLETTNNPAMAANQLAEEAEGEGDENGEIPEDDAIKAYQLQLRNKDEADAVAGLAVGNLEDVVATRQAPKSHDALNMSPAMDFPASRQSQLGTLVDDSFQGHAPESCTCAAGSAELCPYCLMLNGPASGNSSSAFSPNSSATPSMPASFSSMVGMPSQQNGRASMPQSSVSIANGMSPGWSDQQPILVPADENGNSNVHKIEPTKPAAPAVAKAVAGGAKPKKSGGLFSCCFRPKLPETDMEELGEQQPPQQPHSLSRHGNASQGMMSHGDDSVVADELVEDGIPMGGVTATSEDVMQLDGNDVLIQCNVGLSVDDPNARAMPATGGGLNLHAAPASNLRAPLSTTAPSAPVSTGSAAPVSWGAMLPSELAKHNPAAADAAAAADTSAAAAPTLGLGLTEAALAAHAPPSRSGRRAPTSGTSLFSVAEHATAITVGAPAPPSGAVGVGKQGAGQAGPISASLQELQGLDDRRNMYLQSLAAKKEKSSAAPISNTLLELQNRQVVGETANKFAHG